MKGVRKGKDSKYRLEEDSEDISFFVGIGDLMEKVREEISIKFEKRNFFFDIVIRLC